ncbi:MAG: hypothetical protein MZV65_00805 [Chromatiales bacterium]|nr:hypothetical protein [Chromatiales bacterium]
MPSSTANGSDLNLADDLNLDADQIQATVEHLRSLLAEGEVNIEASALVPDRTAVARLRARRRRGAAAQ